jgi:hypothetical protein
MPVSHLFREQRIRSDRVLLVPASSADRDDLNYIKSLARIEDRIDGDLVRGRPEIETPSEIVSRIGPLAPRLVA